MYYLVSVFTIVFLATEIITVFMVKFVTMIALLTNVIIDFKVMETLVTQLDQYFVVKMVIFAVMVNFVTKLRYVKVRPNVTVVYMGIYYVYYMFRPF